MVRRTLSGWGLVAVALVALVLLAPAQARDAATCTAKEQQKAKAALKTYRKAMAKRRRAYFAKHRQAARRTAFVKAQRVKLKRLERAAACTVRKTTPPPPATPPPPVAPPPPPVTPPPPPAPSDTIPPTLTAATVAGTAITLAFDEPLASVAEAAVTVNGAAAALAVTGVTQGSAVLTLGAPVAAGDVVLLNARVVDVAGNATVLVSQAVTNTATPGFSPALAKASWADERSSEPGSAPEFGEWPIDHGYFLPATRVRILLLFVDQPGKPLRWPPQRTFETWTAITGRWERLASYGRLDLRIDRTERVYRLSRDDYGPLPSGGAGPLKDLILEAARLADADVDFSAYDAVWVVGSTGVGARQLRPWPENALVLDGKPILHAELADDFIVETPFIEESGHPMTSAGATHMVLTHELGHHMGLPDTSYKPDPETPYDFSFVAGWDMQDNPAGMLRSADYFAWNKWRLGWIDPAQVRGRTTAGTVEETIAPVETAGGVKLVVAQTSPTFLYAVEVRRNVGNDAGSTCDEGVLVYTVDSTKRNGLGPKFVHAAQAATDPARISTCGLKYAAPFDVGAGEVSTFENADVRVEVLGTDGVNYRVRVTRK